MVIEFKIDNCSNDELKIIDEFCVNLLNNIKSDIYSNIAYAKFNFLERDILNATWIDWIKKPNRINMRKLVNLIISKISCKKRRDNTYVIFISRKYLIPYSNTPLETLARFLDKGNEISPCTTFISRVFNKYKYNINNYWESFVQYKLGKYKVSEVILIK